MTKTTTATPPNPDKRPAGPYTTHAARESLSQMYGELIDRRRHMRAALDTILGLASNDSIPLARLFLDEKGEGSWAHRDGTDRDGAYRDGTDRAGTHRDGTNRNRPARDGQPSHDTRPGERSPISGGRTASVAETLADALEYILRESDAYSFDPDPDLDSSDYAGPAWGDPALGSSDDAASGQGGPALAASQRDALTNFCWVCARFALDNPWANEQGFTPTVGTLRALLTMPSALTSSQVDPHTHQSLPKGIWDGAALVPGAIAHAGEPFQDDRGFGDIEPGEFILAPRVVGTPPTFNFCPNSEEGTPLGLITGLDSCYALLKGCPVADTLLGGSPVADKWSLPQECYHYREYFFEDKGTVDERLTPKDVEYERRWAAEQDEAERDEAERGEAEQDEAEDEYAELVAWEQEHLDLVCAWRDRYVGADEFIERYERLCRDLPTVAAIGLPFDRRAVMSEALDLALYAMGTSLVSGQGYRERIAVLEGAATRLQRISVRQARS